MHDRPSGDNQRSKHKSPHHGSGSTVRPLGAASNEPGATRQRRGRVDEHGGSSKDSKGTGKRNDRRLELFLLPTPRHARDHLPEWETDVYDSVMRLSGCPYKGMGVDLTVVAPTGGLLTTSDLQVIRQNIFASWKRVHTVDILVPQGRDDTPWALVQPTREEGEQERHTARHQTMSTAGASTASSSTASTATVLLDAGYFYELDCAFAEWAFRARGRLRGSRGFAGAALAPATLLQRKTRYIVPYSKPFTHMHPGVGAYVPIPHVWRAFLRWYAVPGQSLYSLQQQLEAAADVLGLVPSVAETWGWHLHFPQVPVGAGEAPPQSWAVWFAAYCLKEQLHSYYLPSRVQLMQLPRAWLPADTRGIDSGVASHYRPVTFFSDLTLADSLIIIGGGAREDGEGASAERQALLHLGWDNAAVPTCASSPCPHGQLCINHARGFVCCTPGSPDCRLERDPPQHVVRVVASCSRPASLLARTLQHLAAAEEALPQVEEASATSGSNAAASRAGLRSRARSLDVDERAPSPHGPSVYLDVVLVTGTSEGGGGGGSAAQGDKSGASRDVGSACRELLGVVDRWPWPYGRRTVQHQHAAYPATPTNVLQQTKAMAALVRALSEPLHPSTFGGQPQELLLLEAGLGVSEIYHAWLRAVHPRFLHLSGVGGVALLPSTLQPHGIQKEQGQQGGDRSGKAGPMGSEAAAAASIGALLVPDVGRGAVMLLSRHRSAFLAWAERVDGSRLLDSGRLRAGKVDGRRLPPGPWHLFAAFVSVFARDEALFFLQPDGRPLGAFPGEEADMAHADAWRAVSLPTGFLLPAVDEQGQSIPMCYGIECPKHTQCHDSLQGAVCMCESENLCPLNQRGEQQQQQHQQQADQEKAGAGETDEEEEEAKGRDDVDMGSDDPLVDWFEGKDNHGDTGGAPVHLEQHQHQPHQQHQPQPHQQHQHQPHQQHQQQHQQHQQQHQQQQQRNSAVTRAKPAGPRFFNDDDALQWVVERHARDKVIIMLTTSSGFVDFFLNWRASARRSGITNYMVVAEDLACYHQLEEADPGHVILSSVRIVKADDTADAQLGKDRKGFSYASKQYNEIVSRRPAYIRKLLRMGYDVLYTDTDTVWLEDPFQHFPPGYDLYIQSDKEDETFDPWHMLCTGFMYMKASNLMVRFMGDWKRALEEQQGKFVNQYIFNDLFQKSYREKMRVYVLPDLKFPSGALFFNPAWRNKQTAQPAVVHNNFIVGPDSKRHRFRELGLWFIADRPRETA